MLHYIIDAYNLLHQMGDEPGLSLQTRRDRLIQFLSIDRPQGSLRNKITLVFDGREGIIAPIAQTRQDNITVIYTQGQSADDKIFLLVSRTENRKNIVVITNDNELKVRVKSLSATVLSVKDFIKDNRHKFIRTKGIYSKSVNERIKPNLTVKQKEQINQELITRWQKIDELSRL